MKSHPTWYRLTGWPQGHAPHNARSAWVCNGVKGGQSVSLSLPCPVVNTIMLFSPFNNCPKRLHIKEGLQNWNIMLITCEMVKKICFILNSLIRYRFQLSDFRTDSKTNMVCYSLRLHCSMTLFLQSGIFWMRHLKFPALRGSRCQLDRLTQKLSLYCGRLHSRAENSTGICQV